MKIKKYKNNIILHDNSGTQERKKSSEKTFLTKLIFLQQMKKSSRKF